jgi:hypothetical protein
MSVVCCPCRVTETAQDDRAAPTGKQKPTQLQVGTWATLGCWAWRWSSTSCEAQLLLAGHEAGPRSSWCPGTAARPHLQRAPTNCRCWPAGRSLKLMGRTCLTCWHCSHLPGSRAHAQAPSALAAPATGHGGSRADFGGCAAAPGRAASRWPGRAEASRLRAARGGSRWASCWGACHARGCRDGACRWTASKERCEPRAWLAGRCLMPMASPAIYLANIHPCEMVTPKASGAFKQC